MVDEVGTDEGVGEGVGVVRCNVSYISDVLSIPTLHLRSIITYYTNTFNLLAYASLCLPYYFACILDIGYPNPTIQYLFEN